MKNQGGENEVTWLGQEEVQKEGEWGSAGCWGRELIRAMHSGQAEKKQQTSDRRRMTSLPASALDWQQACTIEFIRDTVLGLEYWELYNVVAEKALTSLLYSFRDVPWRCIMLELSVKFLIDHVSIVIHC